MEIEFILGIATTVVILIGIPAYYFSVSQRRERAWQERMRREAIERERIERQRRIAAGITPVQQAKAAATIGAFWLLPIILTAFGVAAFLWLVDSFREGGVAWLLLAVVAVAGIWYARRK